MSFERSALFGEYNWGVGFEGSALNPLSAVYLTKKAAMNPALSELLRTTTRLVGALLASLLIGALAAWIVHVQPCQNFGSSFEGACAYGRLATALITGTAVAFLVFAWLGYRILSQRSKDSTGVGELAKPPVGWWLFSLLPFA